MTSKEWQAEMDKEFEDFIERGPEKRVHDYLPNILKGCKKASDIILAETGEDEDTKRLPTIEDKLECLYEIPAKALVYLSERLTGILGEERARDFLLGETGIIIKNAKEAREILRNISAWSLASLTFHILKEKEK